MIMNPRKLAVLAIELNDKYKEGLIREVEVGVAMKKAAMEIILQQVENAESIIAAAQEN